MLAMGSAASARFFRGILPMGLLGILYDAMGSWKNFGLDPRLVHNCDLHALELRFFGITVDGVRVTLHDWLQSHATPALDTLFAIPYGTFLAASLGFAAYLYKRDVHRMSRFGWSFFWCNLAGFITYHLYPAAPPWYYHHYGCQVFLDAPAFEGHALARVDDALGLPYFRSMYGRSSDVFGAMPSLHVAYPLLIVLEGYGVFGPLGLFASVVFALLMAVGAVYLDHHWVLDVVAGLAYALTVQGLLRLAPQALGASFSRGAEIRP
jgi:membrane-associated phospholipid phosphatase